MFFIDIQLNLQFGFSLCIFQDVILMRTGPAFYFLALGIFNTVFNNAQVSETHIFIGYGIVYFRNHAHTFTIEEQYFAALFPVGHCM